MNYITGEWHDRPNYECQLCAYSTLDQGLMEYHQAAVHPVFPLAPTPDAPRPANKPAEGSIDVTDRPETKPAEGHIDHGPALVGEAGPETFTPQEASK